MLQQSYCHYTVELVMARLTLHRIEYRDIEGVLHSIVIAIIPSQTKRYSALLLWRVSSATRRAQHYYRRHRLSNKEWRAGSN